MSAPNRWLFLFGVLISTPVSALQLAGVDVPSNVHLAGHDQALVLNGAGIRKKFFMSIYVGALYLPRTERSADRILSEVPPNRIAMHFVYSKVGKDKIDAAWREGFENNLSAAEFERLSALLEDFTALFGDMREGDTIWLDFVPGQGTRVSINGTERGVVPGREFNAALLGVWLGGSPVTSALKKGMLGVDRD